MHNDFLRNEKRKETIHFYCTHVKITVDDCVEDDFSLAAYSPFHLLCNWELNMLFFFCQEDFGIVGCVD